MCVPSPGSAFRYAGSVATSVFPSPVAISAIFPSWSTMPPISCMSKCRMRTVRRAASRAAANASGRSVSSSSPSVSRFRSCSVLSRSAASESACMSGSIALIASTTGHMRLTSRSCLVPNTDRKMAASISAIHLTLVTRARRSKKLAGVAPRGVRDALPGQHPCQLLDSRLAVERVHQGPRRPAAHPLFHEEVVCSIGRDGCEVGHAEYLPAGRRGVQLLSDHVGDPPADSRIHLIEHERGDLVGGGQNRLHGEHDARELAPRDHLGERTRLLAGIGGRSEERRLRTPLANPPRAIAAGELVRRRD